MENYYHKLPSCKKDAEDLYSLLSSQPYNYKIFGGGPIIGSRLDNDEYAYTKVHKSINNFFLEGEAGQTLLFYFSGHGIPMGRVVYLGTPQINRNKPMNEGYPLTGLTEMMNLSKSARIVCIIDACFSGAAELPESSSMLYKDAPEANQRIALATYDNILDIPKAPGKYLLLSSQAYEPSRAVLNSNSLYSKYIIEGLRGTRSSEGLEGKSIPASVDGYGNVTPETLHAYVYVKVANEVNQVPKMKDETSSDIIIVTHPELAQQPTEESRKSYLLNLLRTGKIEEFNQARGSEPTFLLNFTGENLSGLSLKKANLKQVILTSSNLSHPDLSEACLEKAILNHSDLSNETNLENAILSQAYLGSAKLTSAKLRGAKLNGADLRGAVLKHADLSSPSTNLYYANLSGADLEAANLAGTNLRNAVLVDTNLENAILRGASINMYTNLEGANIVNADLSDTGVFNIKNPLEDDPVFQDIKGSIEKYYVLRQCETRSGQLCEPPYTVLISTDTSLCVRFDVFASHCSPMTIHIYLDGSKIYKKPLGYVDEKTGDEIGSLTTGLINLGPVSLGNMKSNFKEKDKLAAVILEKFRVGMNTYIQ